MSEQVVIGIDGGGTRLRAAIASSDGQLLGSGEAGAGNYHDVGADEVRANIGRAVTKAWAAARLSARRVDAIFLGLGSVVTPEDHAVVRSIVRDLAIVPDDCIGVDHDLRVALAGGLAAQPGIVLIAGTGSSSYGRNELGQSWQAGGWGPILDDPGSSHWLGLHAMIAAIRDHDGRGPATLLRSRVMNALGLSDIREILRRVELEGMKRGEIAALAPLVTAAAAEGDGVARMLIERGVDDLAIMVATVSEQLKFASLSAVIPVVVTGGLTNASSVFMLPLQKAVKRRVPAAGIVEARLPPVLGGVLLAIEMLDLPLTSSIVDRLVSSSQRCEVTCVA
jgi:N-acetylglucosamine kinase-like BadF-type ATPase